ASVRATARIDPIQTMLPETCSRRRASRRGRGRSIASRLPLPADSVTFSEDPRSPPPTYLPKLPGLPRPVRPEALESRVMTNLSPSAPAARPASPHSRAPFAPGGDNPVDPATCERLLGVALSAGGEYADLFFEYRAGGGFSFEEGILKAAS